MNALVAWPAALVWAISLMRHETEEKRVILLANLLRKDPFLIPLAGITRDNLQHLSTACDNQHRWPLIQGDYLSSLILAIYALRNQLTDEWPQYPVMLPTY